MKLIFSPFLSLVILGLAHEFVISSAHKENKAQKDQPAAKNESMPKSCNTAIYYERPVRKNIKKPAKKRGPRLAEDRVYQLITGNAMQSKPVKLIQSKPAQENKAVQTENGEQLQPGNALQTKQDHRVIQSKPTKVIQSKHAQEKKVGQSESRLPPVRAPIIIRNASVKKIDSVETILKGSQETLARQSAETLMKDSHENYIMKSKNKNKIGETEKHAKKTVGSQEGSQSKEQKRVGSLSFLARLQRRVTPEINAPPTNPREWPVLLDEDQYKLELKLARRMNHPTDKLGGWRPETLYDMGKACKTIQSYLNSEPISTPKLIPKIREFLFISNGPYEEDNAIRIYSEQVYVAQPAPWKSGSTVEIPTIECYINAFKMPLFLTSWPQGDRIYILIEHHKYPQLLVVKDFAFYRENDQGVGSMVSKRPKDIELHKY